MIRNLCAAAAAAFVLLIPEAGFGDTAYVQTNLTSDLPGAANLDSNLVNPWGIAFGPTTPIWISDNHTGLGTVYNGAGQPFPVNSPIVVTVPPPAGSPVGTTAAPTGIVFNGSATDFGGSHFIFATEDGTISAWTSGTSAVLEVPGSDAIYKGLAAVTIDSMPRTSIMERSTYTTAPLVP